MKRIFSDKNRLIVIFAGLFAVVMILLLLVFNEGKKTYTVTFDLDGGILLAGEIEQIVPQGQDAIPPHIVKDGYVFEAWSESYTEIKDNKVITAVWTLIPSYTVTFDLDGGTLVEGELEQVITQGYDAVPPNVEKEGYALEDWSESYTGITEDKVLTAIWTLLPTYNVIFDLDGGTLVEGELEQEITHGKNAEPPVVKKDGYYLSAWTVSYNGVSSDIVTKAVWSRPAATSGIQFSDSEFANYCIIVGAYEYLQGDIFLPTSYSGKAVLGINDYAFAEFKNITAVYILNGIVSIGTEAFSNCTDLTIAEIPKTITHFGENAFRGCEALEKVIINEGLTYISSGAFAGCAKLNNIEIPQSVTYIAAGAFAGCEGLEELIIHENVEKIEAGAFEGCENLIIKTSILEDEIPEGWQDGWYGNAQVEWGCIFESESESENEAEADK